LSHEHRTQKTISNRYHHSNQGRFYRDLVARSDIAIEVDGNQHIWIRNRSNNKSEINFWISESLLPNGLAVLEGAEINVTKKNEHLLFLMDSNSLKKHAEAIIEFAKITKAAWGIE
jgi:hypothetical protein